MADPKRLRAAAAKLGARLAHEDSLRKHSAAQARAAENAAVRDKYRRIAEHRRYPKKDRYSWEELVIGSMAMDAGVNRYYAMKAGRQAKQALDYLSQAAQATKPESKAKALRLARRHLADVSRDHHPELVEQLEGRILWEEGWRPETWDSERNAPRAQTQGPSINPQTGQQEFFSFGNVFGNNLVLPNATPLHQFLAAPPSIPREELLPPPGLPPPSQSPAPKIPIPQFPTPEDPYANEPKPRHLPPWSGPPPVGKIPPQPVNPNRATCTPEQIRNAQAIVTTFERIEIEIASLETQIKQTQDDRKLQELENEKLELIRKAQQYAGQLSQARKILTACSA